MRQQSVSERELKFICWISLRLIGHTIIESSSQTLICLVFICCVCVCVYKQFNGCR